MLSQEPLPEAIRRSNLIPRDSRVVVAMSGGPDSTALFIALVEAGQDVIAAHYDHALRAGSGNDAHFVVALCEKLAVPLVLERRAAALPKGSVQAAARSLRYDFLERTRVMQGADLIALGHQADDVVEGVLLHLLRGCGISGLRGMPEQRGVFVRPMLTAWREHVDSFLQRRGIVARIDPSNADVRHARTRVRVQLLPALEREHPGTRERLHHIATLAAELQADLERRAQDLLAEQGPSIDALGSAPDWVAAEALRQLYARAAGAEPALSRSQISAMLRLLQPGRGGRGVDLPRGWRMRAVGRQVEVARGDPPRPEIELDSKECAGCHSRGAVHLKVGEPVRLGHRRPGLRMRPGGGGGSRKLQDLFVDAKVPREERDQWPLVFAGDRLVWVPGVAIDADAAAGPGQPGRHVSLRFRSSGRLEERVVESIDRHLGVPN